VRSVPAGSLARVSDPLALWSAWRACRRGKGRHVSVAHFDLDADTHLFDLARDLRGGTYRPGPWRLRVIHDPKTRLIAAPAVRDRVVHRALLDAIGPTYERSYIDRSYTGAPGRGPHRAVLQHLSWQRRFAYRLHLDIRRYFLSIHHPTLRDLLFRRLRDTDTRALVNRLLASGRRVYRQALAREVLGADLPGPDRGLPLGSYLSQWCGTFYLDGLDHFVKRELKVPGYLRYMDDLVLFDDDPGRLAEAREAIAQWLAQHRSLTLKPTPQAVEPTRAPAVFLGYRLTRAGIAPAPKLRRRLRGRLRLAAERGPASLARSLASYRGLLLFPR
jgi:RNA-directed DNA polymerase